MLKPGFISVLESRDDSQNQIVAFTRRLGFETVSAMVVLDHLAGESEFITVDNTPAGYRDAFNNRTNGPRDPVMQHCRRTVCR